MSKQVGTLKGFLDGVTDDREVVIRVNGKDYPLGRVDLPYVGPVALYPDLFPEEDSKEE